MGLKWRRQQQKMLLLFQYFDDGNDDANYDGAAVVMLIQFHSGVEAWATSNNTTDEFWYDERVTVDVGVAQNESHVCLPLKRTWRNVRW